MRTANLVLSSLALGALALTPACEKEQAEAPAKTETGAAEDDAPAADGLEQAIACHDYNAKINAGEVGLAQVVDDMTGACELGCDAGNAPACAMLERLMAARCQVEPEMCQRLCKSDPDATAGKLACAPPPLPAFMNEAEGRGAALCHKLRLEIELGKTTEAKAIEAGMPALCAAGCDGDDAAACAEAEVVVKAFCAAEAETCTGGCATLPDATLRTLYGCPAIGDDPVAQCTHQAAVVAAAPDGDGDIPLATRCAEACDATNDASACATAGEAVKRMCGDTPELCRELCGTMSSPTLDGLVCQHQGNP